jgi:hypothetical protein
MTGEFGREGVRERCDNGEEGAEAEAGEERGLGVEIDESMLRAEGARARDTVALDGIGVRVSNN